jgi:hypothetical protein
MCMYTYIRIGCHCIESRETGNRPVRRGYDGPDERREELPRYRFTKTLPPLIRHLDALSALLIVSDCLCCYSSTRRYVTQLSVRDEP